MTTFMKTTGQLQQVLDSPSCMFQRISRVNIAIMTDSHEKDNDKEAGG